MKGELEDLTGAEAPKNGLLRVGASATCGCAAESLPSRLQYDTR